MKTFQEWMNKPNLKNLKDQYLMLSSQERKEFLSFILNHSKNNMWDNLDQDEYETQSDHPEPI